MSAYADALRRRIDSLPDQAGAFFRRRLDRLLASGATLDELDALSDRFTDQIEEAAWRAARG